jgi:hypothetical protein
MPRSSNKLPNNVVIWLFQHDTVEASKYLSANGVSFQVIQSDAGYWVNVSWRNGITAPLSHHELLQLPDYRTLAGKQMN